MQLTPGNIWSGNHKLAVFTNPTELAFRKGNLKNHYPVQYKNIKYPDAEAAFQTHTKNHKANFETCMSICTDILIEKLKQYPVLVKTIWQSGGVDWIDKCSHLVNGNRWCGIGRNSAFITCLLRAYCIVSSNDDAVILSCHNCKKEVYSRPYKKEFKNGKGFHLRADCPECDKFIKFISQ